MLQVDRSDFDIVSEINRTVSVDGFYSAEAAAGAINKPVVKGSRASADRSNGTPNWDDYRDCDTQLQSLGSDWDEEGKHLTTMFTGKAICPRGAIDPNCGNDVYVTEYLGTWSEETWSDGDPKFPPPQLPPLSSRARGITTLRCLIALHQQHSLPIGVGDRWTVPLTFIHGLILRPQQEHQSIPLPTERSCWVQEQELSEVYTCFCQRYVYWHIEPDSALVTGQTIPAGTLLELSFRGPMHRVEHTFTTRNMSLQINGTKILGIQYPTRL